MDGILIVDKEQNWTSHDVVAKLRGILGIKKIGHTGTLDPMATGVLPICIGKATKLCEYLTNADKVYRCTIKFGKATTTQDAWGEVQKISLKRPDLKMFRNVLMNFKGEQKQVPPMYSAIKIKGQKLYQLAQQGKIIERPSRNITFYDFKILSFTQDVAEFECHCSKGTYMRTLCHDIGEIIGSYAYMSDLKRISSGPFYIQNAITISEFSKLDIEFMKKYFLPMDFAINDLFKLELKEEDYHRIIHGVKIYTPSLNCEDQKLIRLYYLNKFIGIGIFENKFLRIKKLLI
ncbi:tRNA pseudouridine synthase B [Peptostreptococcaceae bacterium oral taxon 113 str. W5053]|nr:tRNA pseudouridine synthase B [Peptostreptococcaceae bacterium oral taxon 113 str. W5053]